MKSPLFLAIVLCIVPLPWSFARQQDANEIGSLRNARVAFPMQPGERPDLVFLAGNMDESQLAAIKSVAPNVKVITGLTRETAGVHARTAHACDARLLSPEFIAAAPNLVWAQSMSAGVDRFLGMKPLMESERIVFTNMRAVHGPAIADHALAMLLTMTRRLPAYIEHQNEGLWRTEVPMPRPIALQGRTMLVVGLGGIGTEIAQRAHGFGMKVIATRRSDTPGPSFVERVGKSDELGAMIGEADVVAVCVPLTPETERLFNDDMFAKMKQGSFIINIARGKVIDTDALMRALDSGKVVGACLDVTDPEPLPPGHPLWKHANVLITPHVSNDAELTDDRSSALLVENMRRFGAGEPLMNVVDKKAGY